MTDTARDTDLAFELAMLIGRLNRRLRGPGGEALGHGHLSALGTLVVEGPLRLGDLAAREVVSAPSMARTVTSLETRGLVRRDPHPEDGRGVLVSTTPAGEEAVRRGRGERAAILVELLGSLDDAEVAELAEVVPALRRLVTARR